MMWYSTLARLGVCGVACWFGYQAFREHQTTRKLAGEIARMEQELARISPPKSEEIMVQIANGDPMRSRISYRLILAMN